VIYVGKAKNLFNRTHQYFNKAKDGKTTILVEQIQDIDFIVVQNENESLLLEANLIRKHQPKFNILLKSNGGYPYIVVTNEKHPRLLYTRDYKKNIGHYYGPFATAKSNRYDMYGLLLKLFPLRKCSHIPKAKCLYYDIDQCLGPCINDIKPNQYTQYLEQIDNFFKGNPKDIVADLFAKEKKAAQMLNFEEAKKNMELINDIKEASKEMSVSQNINLKSIYNEDIVGYYVKNDLIAIVIFSYIGGKLLTKHQQIADLYGDVEEAINEYLIQYYYQTYNIPRKCFVNLKPSSLKQLSALTKLEFNNPIAGKHKTILQNAAKNAKLFMQSNYLIFKQHKAQTSGAFNELRKILSIDNLTLIHTYDMSNLFGKDKIGAMIAIENGTFNKNLYRKFIIKDLNANSDYAYMYEVIKRQYMKMIKENLMLPNLIIVDGGLIQVNAAIKSLTELNLAQIIPVIGLVKNTHHHTNGIVFPNKKIITLDKKSNVYMFLSNIQEEVHRYAITFFRQKTKDSAFKSILNEIPGLGDKSISKLLNHYDNIANIKNASIDELSQYIQKDIAKAIKDKLV
jgi:excinuclease ABC subunit C